MQWRVKSQAGVRLFAVTVSAVAVVAALALQYLIYPPTVLEWILFPSIVITICVAAPISYFVGLKMLDIHELTCQLEHAVNHDALTETCSRLAFYDKVGKMRVWPMMVIAADIDHFKSVNDMLGHQAGDAVLKQFATTLVRNCREDDIVARFGGEEFVILLRAGTVDEALATAERLRDCVAKRRFAVEACPSDDTVNITASFGVAQVTAPEVIDIALHSADLALYEAKNGGRNRVCVCKTPSDMEAPADHSGLQMRAMPRGAAGVA